VTAEDLRIGHYLAEARAREAAVPGPSPQPVPETHEQAIVSSHLGLPSVATQDKTHGAGLPAEDRGTA